jgi:hypothetical protein
MVEYDRRQDEWDHQANLATIELKQIDKRPAPRFGWRWRHGAAQPRPAGRQRSRRRSVLRTF